MRFNQFNEESAMDRAIATIEKNFSKERSDTGKYVSALARAAEMIEAGKSEPAMKMLQQYDIFDMDQYITAINKQIKNEVDMAEADPDLNPSTKQNIGMLNRALDKLDGLNEDMKQQMGINKIIRTKFRPKIYSSMPKARDMQPIKVSPGAAKKIGLAQDKYTMLEDFTALLEKNVPTNPSKWNYYKNQAKKKFEVYPSAYANAWAAKKYKAAGGGWRKG